MAIGNERFQAGFRLPEASKNEYVSLNKRIKILTENYNQNDIINYLKRLSYNLEI